MSTLDEVRRIKERDTVDLDEVADIVGIPVATLQELPDLGEKITDELARYVVRTYVKDKVAQSTAPNNNPFYSYTVDELRELPDPGWHITGVLPVGSDVMLYGPSYAGKTLVVIDQLLSLANGVPWMGHDTGAPRDVALIVGEGQRGITKRVDAWLAAHPGCSDERLAIVTAMPDIRSVIEVSYLVETFANLSDEHWPQVIAWDTWSRLTVGANENDPSAMTECVTMLAHIREVFGLDATNIVVHHTGHGNEDRPRGASTFMGAFDVRIRVEPGLIVNDKQKDNDEFESIHFDIVKYGHSVTVEKTGAMSAAIQKASELERKIIEVVNEEPGITVDDIRKKVGGRKTAISATVAVLVANERIRQEQGANNRRLNYPIT